MHLKILEEPWFIKEANKEAKEEANMKLNVDTAMVRMTEIKKIKMPKNAKFEPFKPLLNLDEVYAAQSSKLESQGPIRALVLASEKLEQLTERMVLSES